MSGANGDDRGDLGELAADVDEAVNRAVKTVELGRRGFVLSLLAFVLIVGLLLPWAGGHVGWQVLAGKDDAIPQLFAVTSTAFGILATALALATRRWWLAWVCAVGGWFAFVDGVLAIWSQQSSGASGAAGSGPGIGMVIATIGMAVLAAQWMRVAWSRS
ncbi:hypothetical protein B0I33_103623 [Prauserella shujinwangii]|uniref:Transmembrane protein n=1 Tax=Prauserella shujinwangii TaxID=1453103 RepID=A0A2T0LZN8_9PSEU|nr:hypothetical protein B0I33_103623 [Prauserella shujinwangii]